jgi:hypothetical protein
MPKEKTMRRQRLLLMCVFIQHMKEQQSTQSKYHLDRRIPQSALLDPQASRFEPLFVSKNDNALITFCGFNHQAFLLLEIKFTPFFDSNSP